MGSISGFWHFTFASQPTIDKKTHPTGSHKRRILMLMGTGIVKGHISSPGKRGEDVKCKL